MGIYDDLLKISQAQTDAEVAAEDAANARASDMTKGVQMKYTFVDPATGLLKQQYQQKGAEPYIQSLLQQQGQNQSQEADSTAARGQGALTNALTGMGMRGGLNIANRANLTRANMGDTMKAQQSVANQGLNAKLGINVKGAEMNQAVDTANVQNAMKAAGQENEFDLNKYMKNREVQAANENAKATAKAGEGGSWVCTESHNRNPLTKKQAFALFKLRKFALKNYKDMSRAYLYEFKPLVEKMLEKGDDWAENNAFVLKVVELVEEQRIPEAFKFYVNYIQAKVEIFWPECKNEEYLKLKGDI